MPIKHARDRSPSLSLSLTVSPQLYHVYIPTHPLIYHLWSLPTSLSFTTILLPFFYHIFTTILSPLFHHSLIYRRQRIITDPKVKQMITIRDTLMEYDLMMAMCSIGKIISLTHSYPLLILPHTLTLQDTYPNGIWHHVLVYIPFWYTPLSPPTQSNTLLSLLHSHHTSLLCDRYTTCGQRHQGVLFISAPRWLNFYSRWSFLLLQCPTPQYFP